MRRVLPLQRPEMIRLGILAPTISLVLLAAACGSSQSDTQPQPAKEEIVEQAVKPPPISGGTLIAARDGATAIAADPDRDTVWITNVNASQVVGAIALTQGDEPTRMVEDLNGTVHVVLRGGGAIASIDLNTKKLVSRRSVCPEPRGIAFDPSFSGQPALHIACATGELVTMPLAGTTPLRKVILEPDLRDVIVSKTETLFVSRFRAAELLRLDATGAIVDRTKPASVPTPTTTGETVDDFVPEVAWRIMELPSGEIAMLHQRAKASAIEIKAGAYVAGQCDSAAVVHGTVSLFKPDPTGGPTPTPIVGVYLPSVVLPVDFTLTADGTDFLITSAGTDHLLLAEVWRFRTGVNCGWEYGTLSEQFQGVAGQPISLVTMPDGTVLTQLREPAGLAIASTSLGPTATSLAIRFTDESRLDTGHEMFHRPPSADGIIACASCHIEGGDDGHTWQFLNVGPRRTQNLRGGILPTAPFHWAGDLLDFPSLVHDTMVFRMGGDQPSPAKIQAFGHFLQSIRHLKAPSDVDLDAAKHGEALYNDKVVACASCHAGTYLTDDKNHDVGTGGMLQVPSMHGVWARGPFLHDGCAKTLADRFGACATPNHGNTSALSASDINDLIEYLRSL